MPSAERHALQRSAFLWKDSNSQHDLGFSSIWSSSAVPGQHYSRRDLVFPYRAK